MRKIFPINSKKFGLRLKALMDYNNMDSMDLAVKLCNYGQKPKMGTPEYDVCRTKYRTIKNHLKLGNLANLTSNESLTTFYVSEYCNVFHCSADYLLGYIDYPTHSDTDVAKAIGLSLTSISSLRKIKGYWDHTVKETLDFILKNDNVFLDFLKWISIYIDNPYTIPITFNEEKRIYEKCGYTVNGENVISLGQEMLDNKGNLGYKIIGVGIDILESHSMLKIQEILLNWKNMKKDGD